MDLKDIIIEAKKEIELSKNSADLESVFQKYLGKRGKISQAFDLFVNLPAEKRKEAGMEINQIKNELKFLIENKKNEFKKNGEGAEKNEIFFDETTPGLKINLGHLHPISIVRRKIEAIFERLGFSVVEGPEIEDEWHNFDALNIPKDHPARDMWDTFWLKEPKSSKLKTQKSKLLLRTHTSPVQIRYMKKNKPPLKIIAPGRIFRYEATDASHEINFYQVEGLMIDRGINFANFRAVMEEFFRAFLGEKAEIRFRASYFPFTEPSAEIDVKCTICEGLGCGVCSNRGWIEVAGAGMVHSNVFNSVKIDPKKWQGFAFGMGLDRLVMMKYRVEDVRMFYSGDIRFLTQF